MKKIGFILIVVGILIIVYVAYSVMKENTAMKSPIPDDSGVKVIYISPSQ